MANSEGAVMTHTPKPCTCTITLPTPEYNKMVEYIKKLENAVGKACYTCIGCENEPSVAKTDCDNWIWNGGSK